VLQRQSFKDKFKTSEKAPPLQKPQEWGTQLQKLTSTSKANFEDLEKKNGINNYCLPRLLR
jgi:hypothetical protein